MYKIIGIITIGLLAYWAYSAFKPLQWYGIYESRATNDLFAEKSESREACSTWLEDKQLNPGRYTNYECGSDCVKPDRLTALYECKETFD